MRFSSKLLPAALVVALAAGGVGTAVVVAADPAGTLPKVTYTANGQTVTGRVWQKDGDKWLVSDDSGDAKPALAINPSDVVVLTTPTQTTTTPPVTTTTTTPPPVSSTSRPFSDASPFNQLVGTPTVLSNSTAIVNASGIGSVPSALSTDRQESINYDHPVYYPTASDPIATLKMTSTNQSWKVPVPNYATIAGASDHHIAIVYGGWEYNLWNATKSGTAGNYTFTAAIGGRLPSDGLGIKPASAWNDPTVDGGTEAKFSERAGIVSAAELQAGQINHALFVVASGSDGSFVYPGFNSTNKNSQGVPQPVDPNGTRPHMGTRFWLNMSDAAIDASGAPAWEKTFAHAAHQYGIYVGDKGGAGFGFMLESSTPYNAAGTANPWDTYWPSQGVKNTGQYGYVATFSGKIPWKTAMQAIAPPAA